MAEVIPKTLRDAGYEMCCDIAAIDTRDIPTTNLAIEDLVWIFDLPLWGKDGEDWNLTPRDVINRVPGSANQWKRVEDADLAFPLLVCRKNNKWLVLDGVHRLVKMSLEGKTTVSVKILPDDTVASCSRKIPSGNCEYE